MMIGIWEVGVGIWYAYQNPHPYHPHNSHVVYQLPGLLCVQHFRARDIRDDKSMGRRWEQYSRICVALSSLITVFLWLIQSLDAQHTKWMMPVKLDGEFSFENMFNIVLCGEDKAVFRQHADRRYGIRKNSDDSIFVIVVTELVSCVMVDNSTGLLFQR